MSAGQTASGLGANWGLLGHEWAVELLAGRLAAGLAGAPVLFTGAEGVGRGTLARAYAQALNCTGAAPPCGECRACRLIAAGRHPDVLVVEPITTGRAAVAEEIRIDQVREVLHDLSLTPVEARRRVALIRRAELANAAAANALLKTLEEPPGSATLLLTASAAEALWPTVVSRCQVLALRPLPREQVRAALVERWGVEPALAGRLARASGGRPGWALRLAQEPQRWARREAALESLAAALRGTRVERFAQAEALARDPALRETLEAWGAWWRDVLLLAAGSRAPLAHPEQTEDLRAQAARGGLAGAAAALSALARAREQLERNAPVRLVLEVLLLELGGR